MTAELIEKSSEAKVVVSYSDSRRKNMKEIGERVCLATMDLVKQRIDLLGISILKIRHAKTANGTVDLTYLVSAPEEKLKLLDNSLSELNSERYGISNIGIYIAEPI